MHLVFHCDAALLSDHVLLQWVPFARWECLNCDLMIFRFRSADPSYMKLYQSEVEAFKDRLRKRGKDKRDAAIEEYEAEEKAKRIAASPGGLDPQEVYDSLPDVSWAFRHHFIAMMYGKQNIARTGMGEEVQHPNLRRSSEKVGVAGTLSLVA